MRKTGIKRLLCTCISILLMAGMVGNCAVGAAESPEKSPSDGVLYTAGSYTASAQGNNGPVAVTVEFSENEILSVVVGEHAETPGISDAPISRIPEAIVSEQTLDVDTVSGATHTSEAILTAVADCVAQAGGNVEALKTKQSGKDEAMKEVTLEVDVVVAGSGISGMCAAISAAEEGANVLLLEKQGVIGGSAGTSGGGFIVVNSHFEKEAGIEDTKEAAVDRWMNWGNKWDKQYPEYRENDKYPDRAKLEFVVDRLAENIEWVESQGVDFGKIRPADGNLTRVSCMTGGSGLLATLCESAQKKGVQILMETPAVSLIMDNGKVAGLVAQSADTTYRIMAKGGVVLCTGGFSHNLEMMEEMVPEYAGNYSSAAIGDTGDGIRMAAEVGAALYDLCWVEAAGPVFDTDLTSAFPDTFQWNDYRAYPMIDSNGVRFQNENTFYAALGNTMAAVNSTQKYSVMDSAKEEYKEALEAGSIMGSVLKADTLEELAALIGCDANTLVGTIERYNSYAETGIDEEFPLLSTASGSGGSDLTGDVKTPVVKSPFYAVKVCPSYMGTIGGVITDDDARVLDEQGNPIENLYAAGETSNRCYFDHTYMGSCSLGTYSLMGRIAGRNAAQNAAE